MGVIWRNYLLFDAIFERNDHDKYEKECMYPRMWNLSVYFPILSFLAV